MIGITKESINFGNFVDKKYKKTPKTGFIKKMFSENKFLMYLFGAATIFTIANITLIYSFYKILIKI